MSILTKLFKNNKQILAYKMSNNIEDFYEEIINRKYWDKINQNVMKAIIENANGNAESIRHFIHISEVSGLLENNFLRLSNTNNINEKDLLSLFAISLRMLGDEHHRQAIARHGDIKAMNNTLFKLL